MRFLIVDESREFRSALAGMLRARWPEALVDEWDPRVRGRPPAPPRARYTAVLLDVDPAAPTVRADPVAVRQVLGNLVENAVRYTPGGGTVTIFSRAEDGGVRLGVRNTGTGIPSDHLPRIFERFYRVDPARSRAAGGTGLGLAIVKHLVEAHGGRVYAESAAGQGTTVRAFFPS